jgi:hypothetical protein
VILASIKIPIPYGMGIGGAIIVLIFIGIAWLFRRTVLTRDDEDISRPL